MKNQFAIMKKRSHTFSSARSKAWGHFTIGSYGDVHSQNFCYDAIPEFLLDFESTTKQYENC